VLARAGAEEQDLHGDSLDDGGRLRPGIAGPARPGAPPPTADLLDQCPYRFFLPSRPTQSRAANMVEPTNTM